MARFVQTSTFPASPDELYAWHAAPGALARLSPPWQAVRRVGPEQPLAEGQRVELRLRMGPLWVPWVAHHRDLVEGRQFVDEQVFGPFARWVHLHRFSPVPGGGALDDEIDYEFRGGALAERFGEPLVRGMLRRMFGYRHEVLRGDLERHLPWRDRPRLRVAVTGATGLVGRQFCAFLTTGGHQVLRLTRRPDPGRADEVGWDPRTGFRDPAALEGVDAVVHLAGETISGRWTPERKKEILESRRVGTEVLSRALAGLARPPRVLVSSSATGFYGDRGEEALQEDSPPGTGFLAEVCRAWEGATEPAVRAGIRVVQVRTGLVLTPAGGALAKMLPPFQLGAGGPTGSGRQYWSWISLDDLLGVLHLALQDEGLSGPVNAVAGTCSNADFARTLGRVLGRPALLPLPGFAVRMLLGQMGEELLLQGARVLPGRLRERGFSFQQADLEGALRHELGLPRR